MPSSNTLSPDAGAPPKRADERLIRITPSAGVKIAELMEREAEGPYLRISISGGGCNGLSYRMKFCSESKKGDILVVSQEIEVLVDVKSALYLKGMVLDYSTDLMGGGFKFGNPNAKASCSCGESFSI